MGRKPKNPKPETDDIVIDLDSYDWGDVRLTKKEKLFIIHYTTPGTPYYMDGTQAAKKAGYKPQSAYQYKIDLLGNPKVKKLVDEFSDKIIKVSVQECAKRLIEQKMMRATYNVKDYLQVEEFTNRDGASREITTVKPINELTREQAAIIDNIQVNNIGICTYALPNREKEINDIIKLNDSLNKGADADKFDVETTVDVVKDNLATIKTTVMLRNQEIRESAGNYIETSDELPEYD